MSNAKKMTTMSFRGISLEKEEAAPRSLNILGWAKGLIVTSALYLALFYFVLHNAQ